ncbi:MAG: radical SAM protein, partial [Desulfuromonadales bacterium]|nr:radical SAM protein [Desulfuromonadales bacterium]NIS41228.1 radical SAM protein [Desulfuromonadales bacterium]
MSKKLIEKARNRLNAERGCRSNPWGGRLSVALVYPNTYHQAMSNLGFLSIYHLLNSRDDTLCERFFLPDREDHDEHLKTGYPLFSLESGRYLSEFDVIAFSISFENDYLNLPAIFDLGQVPLFAVDREERFPLVLCGGVCAFLNPEPLAEVMDVFAIGEGEVIVGGFIEELLETATDRRQLLSRLARRPGLYVPSLYDVDYHDDGTIAGCRPQEGVIPRVTRQWVADVDRYPARTFVTTEETEFSGMALTEISRGCSRGCRFCAAGYLYLPPRERSVQSLKEDIGEGLCHRDKIGLVGAAVSDYSELETLEEEILGRGGKVSVASLRIDSLTEREVKALEQSGHRTVSLAPEAGSQRMRDLINKGLDEEQILRAVRLLGEGGILNLKLYFLIGLPREDEADIDEMLELVSRARAIWLAEGKKRGRLGTITLSVNPFIPKPATPFQWAGMEGEKSLQKKMRRIRSAVARLPNTEVVFESLRAAVLQAFLSRGDRRIAGVLPLLAQGKNLRAACRQAGLDPAFYVTRERGEQEILPWEVVDVGVKRDYLLEEYRRGLEGHLTPRCAP